jgi:hypothetical protein
MQRFLFMLFLLLGGFHLLPLEALTIEGYAANSNDRFANHPDFIAKDFNLSGVAISSDGRWVTMISPNVFLTAWHFTPGTGETVTFHQSNDPNGPSVTRTISGTKEQIGDSDLRLVVLDQPLPEGYTYYTRATESLPTGIFWTSYPYRNKEHFHFGRSPGAYSTQLDFGVGKNVVDIRKLDVTVSNSTATGPAIEAIKNTDSTAVAYETYALDGDSSAPLMYESSGALKLVGIAWYRTTSGDPPVPYSTGFSPVGNYNSAINTFLTTHSLPYQPLAPSAFSGSRITPTRIDLTWQDNSDVETEYLLERRETEIDDWVPIANLPANTLSYSDTAAPAGDVFYKLTAKNDTASDSVAISILTPYSTWAAQFDWGSADQNPTADANNDGLANLIAYSMDLSPLIPVPVEAMPRLEFPVDAIDYLYRRDPDASDLSFKLYQKSDLLSPTWTEIIVDGSTVTESDIGPADSARWFRIRMPASQVTETGFFRLEIDSAQLP